MNSKSDFIIILDNGHGVNTPGKQSPDKSLKEYQYTREIVSGIHESLNKLGYKSHVLVPEETDVSLNIRVKRANQIYKNNNKKAILISVHCNAAGSDGKWHNASGWSVFVAQNSSKNSQRLATNLAKTAGKENLKIRLQYSDKFYWIQSLAICRDTNCPAVLTENLFQDNKEDVKFLLSEEGKQKIVNLHVNGIINYLNNE